MLAEVLLLMWFIIFAAQQSTLYCSLVLVPTSATLMVCLKSSISMMGLAFFIFVMVFIGGLLVLLVSVSSLSTQEQGVMVGLAGLMWASGLIVLASGQESSISSLAGGLVIWVLEDFMGGLMFTFLIVALAIISVLAFKFKGLIRSVCLFGVENIPLFHSGELKVVSMTIGTSRW